MFRAFVVRSAGFDSVLQQIDQGLDGTLVHRYGVYSQEGINQGAATGIVFRCHY